MTVRHPHVPAHAPTPVDDRLAADQALARLRRGERLLYTGDYRNARQLLSALGRRLAGKAGKAHPGSVRDLFLSERMARGREATLLSGVLVELDEQLALRCARAPDVAEACRAAWGDSAGARVLPLRELLGVLGSWEWQRKGIPVAALGGAPVHPHYGVFGPVRQEYVDLVASAPAPKGLRVFDVGTGTGVLSLVLARAGAREVVATDIEPRAVSCARENVARFGLSGRVEVLEADLFPEGTADRVVFNPPWLPLRPHSPIESALYDEGHQLLRRFLSGVSARLAPGGEAWLVISDLAVRLGLREAGALEHWWTEAGLSLAWKREIRPTHKRAADPGDPLHAARSGEVTSLFALTAAR